MDQVADEPRPAAKMQPPQRKAQTPATANDSTITGRIQAIDEKKGTKNSKPWTKWSIKVDDKWHGTFDAQHRDTANEAREAGLPVTIEFKTTEFGRDIAKIAIADAPTATTPAKPAAAAANGQLPIEREPGAEG
jgi:hypothetical protein